MKLDFVFVDAENVSTSVIKNIPSSHGKEVYIFSKLVKMAELSRDLGFHCISDYPKGHNQADFSIIALLVAKIKECRFLNKVVEPSLRAQIKTQFTLYSHDKGLIEAFTNQCGIYSVNSTIIRPNPNPTSRQHLSPQARILFALKTPQKLNNDLWARLQLTQSEFSKGVTELIRSGLISRSSHKKKYWVARGGQ